MVLPIMLLVTNQTASPASGSVRVGVEKVPYSFQPWESVPLEDGIALALHRWNVKKFHVTSLPQESSDEVRELKAILKKTRRELTMAKKSMSELKEQIGGSIL